MSILNDLSRPSETASLNVKQRFSTREICNAFKTTLTYMISDSFALNSEETMWLGYQVKETLNPFCDKEPRLLPASVTHELLTHQYSNFVAQRKGGTYLNGESSGDPADLKGWSDVIMEMVRSSYEPDLMMEAQTRARVTSILKELGLGKDKNPRAAFYLPNAIRWNANQKKAASRS